MARLIDTSVFVAAERGGLPLGVMVADAPDEPFALASITVAELLVGAEKADSADRRRHRLAFVDAVGAAFPVLPLDVSVAEALARLWAGLDAVGGRIGPYDMVVAATALVHGYDVLTFNVREFARVPGLVVRRPDW